MALNSFLSAIHLGLYASLVAKCLLLFVSLHHDLFGRANLLHAFHYPYLSLSLFEFGFSLLQLELE